LYQKTRVTATTKNTAAAKAVQAERKEENIGVMDDLIRKYRCPSRRCPNQDGWCYIKKEVHHTVTQTHFDTWISAIRRGDEDVDMITPSNDLKFMPVEAVRGGKRKEKPVESSSSSCQSEHAPSGLSGQGHSYSEALMPLLFHQMMMPIQQQLTMLSQQQLQQFAASGTSSAYTLPQLQPILAVQPAETVPLPLSLMSVPFRRIISLKRPTSSFNRHLPSSPIRSIGDRGSHLRIYINWLQRQSPSLAKALEEAYRALDKEHYGLTTVQGWADKEEPWTRLNVPVGLGLQIADKASLKDWWYDEGRHGTVMSEISEQDAKQMALNAIDIERIEG